MFDDRVLSGMRPTGRMHLGHYHGALKNWVRLQEQYECFYFVADWHALTTHYETPELIADSAFEMVVDWLAAGIDPAQSTVFVQSQVLEHAELTLLLGMTTPVGWLERVPTYKDQQQKIADRDLSTYGFLGYPVMMGADILIYRANMVPVGEDQVSHLELTREMARRFNHFYGREPEFEEKAQAAIKKLGSKKARRYEELRKAFQERGDTEALEAAKTLLEETQNLPLGDRERLFGYLEGARRVILVEPKPLLTETSKVPGTDGQKMSKSYGNAIFMREEPTDLTRKIRTMQTDPARMRRSDPGNPECCPVWPLHQIYSDKDVRDWVVKGCTTAGIGCLECKQPVIDGILKEQEPIRERAQPYLDDPALVRNILADGCTRARKQANETMRDVREAMGVSYDRSFG
ncbi:MAG: tryptophan--tRNA ligase [Burkholderiales bacterium]|jgi:tryptophanyl-tRNA synthetase|nr:tryptophan--tRNA ligase [Burkholderiales bacterium]